MTFTGVLGSPDSLLARIELGVVAAGDAGGRAWTYHGDDTATYGGTVAFSYGRTPDWTYTPVTS